VCYNKGKGIKVALQRDPKMNDETTSLDAGSSAASQQNLSSISSPDVAQPAVGDWVAQRKRDGVWVAWAASLMDLDDKVRTAGEDPGNVLRFRYFEDELSLGGIEIEVADP
jgi:hypothetical protein